MGKIILDLCGGTGAWGKPYLEAGYDVKLITLPSYNVLHYIDLMPKDIYGILAAPPCTMFSLARQNARMPRDMESGMKIVRACLEIIWNAQYNEGFGLKFWAMENPRGYLRRFMGKPAYTFEQWMFDEKSQHCKPTDLWGNFQEPKQIILLKPDLQKNRNRRLGNWQKPIPPPEYNHITDRAAIRAITPSGFAQAFFKANQ